MLDYIQTVIHLPLTTHGSRLVEVIVSPEWSRNKNSLVTTVLLGCLYG